MKKITAFLVLICVLALAAPAAAQDSSSDAKCDLPSLQTSIDTFVDAAGKLKDETDPLNISNGLQELANEANSLRANCDGLSFSGTKQIVIGPVTIPEGIYRAKATTTGYMITHVDALSGECGVGVRFSSQSLFNISEGEANDGAEAVFASKGCSALITVENVREDWQIVFERISTD